MYLTDVLLENVGPITRLDLEFPFAEGSPKPVILVGTNGSGKTVLLSTIADALIEMQAAHYQDIMPTYAGTGHTYFKLCGPLNRRMGCAFSLSMLTFAHNTKKATYVEKTGSLDQASYQDLVAARFPGATWENNDVNHKRFHGFSQSEVRDIATQSTLCFFPSTRRELPHWLNTEAVGERPEEEPKLWSDLRIGNRLRKPVFVERSREKNKRWILDVMFDCRSELERGPAGELRAANFENLNDRLKLTQARLNIDKILGSVLNVSDLRIHANYRHMGYRLSIAKGSDIIIPSLDHLSLGQTLLFNLFCTVARYADMYDLNKGHTLNQIEGIVVIDEADAHLHTDLQYSCLPKLIKLFPKVQFIITTHAPMLLLGMEREFGEDGVAVIELPQGTEISTERFSEFQRSLDYYQHTKRFEDSVQERLFAATKPTVYLEGDTDRDYVITALEVLNRQDLAAAIDCDWAGTNVNGVAQGGGTSSLDSIAKPFKSKPGLLQRKLLLLHDCDTNKPDSNPHPNLFIRSIPKNPANHAFKKGIENLLPYSLAESRFYDEKTDDYSGSIKKLNKRRLCDWVIAQKDPGHFAGFAPVIQILEEFIGIHPQAKLPPPQEAVGGIETVEKEAAL